MGIFKKSIKAISATAREISNNLLGFSEWLGQLVRSPFADLKRVFGRREVANKKSGFSFKHLLLLPVTIAVAILSLVLRVLMSPFDLVAGLIQGRVKTILWSLAGMLVLFGVAAFGANSLFGGNRNSAYEIELRRKAADSFRNESYELAAEQYDELVSICDAYDSEKLNHAISHAKTGNKEKSTAILKTLAPGPDGIPGYPKAHQAIALSILGQMQSEKTRTPELLSALRWHLSCSGSDQPPEIHIAWAEYHSATSNFDEAISHLKSAAIKRPELWVMIAEIYRQQNNDFERTAALKRAAEVYSQIVSEDAKNEKGRITLSRIFFDLKRYSEAESTLLEGIKLADSKSLRSAGAGFYVSLYQRRLQDRGANGSILDLFELLEKALAQDVNHLPTYQALIRLYRIDENTESRRTVVETLEKILENPESAGLAHFSLSNIFWVEKDSAKSQYHMEEAFRANSKFSVIANNLAWILAHSDPPELERARSMAAQVVAENPTDGRFRDTLATIMMKQNEYPTALTEFQKALPTADNRKEIHQKMADIYRKLNKTALAIQHQEQADAN